MNNYKYLQKDVKFVNGNKIITIDTLTEDRSIIDTNFNLVQANTLIEGEKYIILLENNYVLTNQTDLNELLQVEYVPDLDSYKSVQGVDSPLNNDKYYFTYSSGMFISNGKHIEVIVTNDMMNELQNQNSSFTSAISTSLKLTSINGEFEYTNTGASMSMYRGTFTYYPWKVTVNGEFGQNSHSGMFFKLKLNQPANLIATCKSTGTSKPYFADTTAKELTINSLVAEDYMPVQYTQEGNTYYVKIGYFNDYKQLQLNYNSNAEAEVVVVSDTDSLVDHVTNPLPAKNSVWPLVYFNKWTYGQSPAQVEVDINFYGTTYKFIISDV